MHQSVRTAFQYQIHPRLSQHSLIKVASNVYYTNDITIMMSIGTFPHPEYKRGLGSCGRIESDPWRLYGPGLRPSTGDGQHQLEGSLPRHACPQLWISDQAWVSNILQNTRKVAFRNARGRRDRPFCSSRWHRIMIVFVSFYAWIYFNLDYSQVRAQPHMFVRRWLCQPAHI